MKEITNEMIKNATIRCEYSYRGGGIKIDLQPFGYPEGSGMTAYQNYLGGGMLGSIQNSCNISNWMEVNDLLHIARELAKYFHELTRHRDDEWEDCDFEQNQNRPSSAY